MDNTSNRRPLRSRSTAWAQLAAQAILKTGLSANAVSTIGVIFAAAGAGAFLLAPQDGLWWLAGALFIQLRLLANMLDGLVAVEGGKGSATGPLFNEVPDRIEDSLFLVAAGYACHMPELGWLAALAAMATAYARALGGSFGFGQDFTGPMAKQHRMAVLTLAALAAAAVPGQPVMALALALIAAGSLLTATRRVLRLARKLKEVRP